MLVDELFAMVFGQLLGVLVLPGVPERLLGAFSGCLALVGREATVAVVCIGFGYATDMASVAFVAGLLGLLIGICC